MAVTDLWYRQSDPDKPTKRVNRGLRWRVTVPGSPSKSFRTKKAAEAWEAKLMVDGPQNTSTVTMNELLDLYWQSKAGLSKGGRSSVASGVGHARQRWGSVLPSQIERHEVEAWLGGLTYQRRIQGELVTKPASRTLTEKTAQALAGALQIAVRRRTIAENPAADIRLPKVERRDPRFLTLDELDALADEVGAWWSPMVMCLATTGMRVGECCSRTVGDVREVKTGLWRVRVTMTKGRRARDVPIPASVVGMLNRGRPRTAALFTYPTTGERVKTAPFRNRVFQPAAVRAGLGDLHVHDLRHTAASMMIAAGADVKKVQEALGHKSAAITLDLYGHLWEAGLDEVGSRVDAMLTGHRLTRFVPGGVGKG